MTAEARIQEARDCLGHAKELLGRGDYAEAIRYLIAVELAASFAVTHIQQDHPDVLDDERED